MNDNIHSLVAPYAINAVTDAERAEFEAHLEWCAECRDEVASFAAVTEFVADAEATTPPPSLRSRVMEEVDATAQLTPTSPVTPTTDVTNLPQPASASAHKERKKWRPTAVLAAASVALVAAVGTFVITRGDDAPQSQVAMEQDVMMVTTAPDATTMDVDLGNGHLVLSARMDSVAVMGAEAPMPDDGMEYQIWLVMADGKKIPGPTFMPKGDGEYMTVAKGEVEDLAAIAVTQEPVGGSDEPTSDPVCVTEV